MGEALHAISNKGFYYTDFITGKLVHSLQNDTLGKQKSTGFEQMNDREKEFLQLACSEMTYNEIAGKMFLSQKTIDGYRNSLFEKLNVKSRVGLVMYAIKNRIIKVDWDYLTNKHATNSSKTFSIIKRSSYTLDFNKIKLCQSINALAANCH